MRERPIATVIIRRAGEMTPAGRRVIAEWLRGQAAALMRKGKRYAPHYTARYMAKPTDRVGCGDAY